MLRSKQRFAEAIAAYDRAIARITTPAPTDWLVFYDRGICYERSHQWPKAEADFRHALNLAPDQPFVLNYLGYSWADMGQNLTAGAADDREGGRSSGRTTARSSTAWAGSCSARANRRGGEDAGTGGRAGARGCDDQRPPGRCLLGGRPQARGELSVAPGADVQSRSPTMPRSWRRSCKAAVASRRCSAASSGWCRTT